MLLYDVCSLPSRPNTYLPLVWQHLEPHTVHHKPLYKPQGDAASAHERPHRVHVPHLLQLSGAHLARRNAGTVVYWCTVGGNPALLWGAIQHDLHPG